METKNFAFPVGREEERALGVVRAVREELQRQVRVRRAALAQVQLDRVRLPAAVGAGGEKVDGEPAENASPGERLADLHRLLRNLARILVARREDGPEKELAARAAEQLIVGRELLDLPHRRRAHLYARAADLRADDDSSSTIPPSASRSRNCSALAYGSSGRRSSSRSSTRARPAPSRPRTSSIAFPSPDTPSSCFRTTDSTLGLRRCELDHRIDDVVARAHPLAPLGMVHARLGEQRARSALRPERG